MKAISIEMMTNEVYGVVADGNEIITTPNEVYGISLSS